VRYTDPQGSSRIGFTHDVSSTGLFVLAGTPPVVGQELSVELQTPDGRNLRFQGRVVRQKRVPLALAASVPGGFGLGLNGLCDEYQALVASLP
jgi:hypothetical protein